MPFVLRPMSSDRAGRRHQFGGLAVGSSAFVPPARPASATPPPRLHCPWRCSSRADITAGGQQREMPPGLAACRYECSFSPKLVCARLGTLSAFQRGDRINERAGPCREVVEQCLRCSRGVVMLPTVEPIRS